MYLTLYELSSNILLLRGERAVEAINKFAPIPLSSVWVKRVYKMVVNWLMTVYRQAKIDAKLQPQTSLCVSVS